MCLKSPVRGGIKTGRSECAFYTKVILVSLNAICNFFQCFEIVQLIDGFDLCIVQCKIVI